MITPAILSPGIEGFGQVSTDASATAQILPEGKLFQSLLSQKFTSVSIAAATAAKSTTTKLSPGTSSVTTPTASGEEPLDVLKLLSELEASEGGSRQPFAGSGSTEPESATDQNPDATTPTLDPQAMLALLQTTPADASAAAAAAATSAMAAMTVAQPASASASTPTTADADSGSTVDSGALAVDTNFASLTLAPTVSAAVGDSGASTAGAGKSPLQTLHEQFMAQEPAGPISRQDAPDHHVDAPLALTDASVSIFRIESLGTDAGAVVLQTTQVSTHSLDNGTSASASLVERTVSVPVGQRGWSEAVGAQVQWMVDHRVQSARLQVTPDGMGPIDVRLSVDNNNVTVNFMAQHPDTRQALEDTLPQLRALLSGAGLSLGQATVQQQSQQSQQSAPWPPAGGQNRDVDHNEDDSQHVPLSVGLGLVDEYV